MNDIPSLIKFRLPPQNLPVETDQEGIFEVENRQSIHCSINVSEKSENAYSV